jgi:preprotein translocase subunit SecA
MIANILSKIFGSKHEKEVKLIRPVVVEINKYYEEYHKLSDDEIKNKTNEFKELIQSRIKDLEAERELLQHRLQEEDLHADEIMDLTQLIKGLGDEIFSTVNDTLDEILPQAFAVVKQTCKRLQPD